MIKKLAALACVALVATACNWTTPYGWSGNSAWNLVESDITPATIGELELSFAIPDVDVALLYEGELRSADGWVYATNADGCPGSPIKVCEALRIGPPAEAILDGVGFVTEQVRAPDDYRVGAYDLDQPCLDGLCETLWDHTADLPDNGFIAWAAGAPQPASDRVYVLRTIGLLSNPQQLIAFDRNCVAGSPCDPLWSRNVGAFDRDLDAVPAVAPEAIYVTSRDGQLFAVGHDGSLLWTGQSASTQDISRPVVSGDHIYMTGNNGLSAFRRDAACTSSGFCAAAWSPGGGQSLVAEPNAVIAGGELFDPAACDADPEGCSAIWRADPPPFFSEVRMIAAGGLLYRFVRSDNLTLEIFDVTDPGCTTEVRCEPTRSIEIGDVDLTGDPMISNGQLYVPAHGWMLVFALRETAEGLSLDPELDTASALRDLFARYDDAS